MNALFALGFRPFFTFGTIYSVLLILVWVGHLNGLMPTLPDANGIFWHSYEMVYGFATAIVSGFLLTASQNWSGVPGLKGSRLKVLVGVWFLGRLLPIALGFEHPVSLAVNLAYFPLLSYFIFPNIGIKQQKRNWWFFLFFAVLFLGQVTSFWGSRLGLDPKLGVHIGLWMVIMMISLIASRVVPFFASRVLPAANIKSDPLLDKACFYGLWIGFGLSLLHALGASPIPSHLTTTLLKGIGLLHLLRFVLWAPHKTLKLPILNSLYLAYFWLTLGLLDMNGPILSGQAALHIWTIGAIGGFIYAMVSRVSLGHTGRPIKGGLLFNLGYFLINGAVIFRILPHFVKDTNYALSMSLSGSLWALAFLILAINVVPKLLVPRPDGKPG